MYLSLELIQQGIFWEGENLKRLEVELAIRLFSNQPCERLIHEINKSKEWLAQLKEIEQQRQGV